MSTSQAEQLGLLPEQPQLDPERIEIVERLSIIRREAGFLPTSRGELNEAFGLLAFRQERGGAARHLAEVATHQRKHGVADPSAATRSITREYAGYAQRARTDRTMLQTLRGELQGQQGVNPLQSADPAIITGRAQLARFIDLSELARGADIQTFPMLPLRGYTTERRDASDLYVAAKPGSVIAKRIDSILGGLRYWDAERATEAAIQDQTNRFNFHTKRLQEIERHQMGQTRAVAHTALVSLGVIER